MARLATLITISLFLHLLCKGFVVTYTSITSSKTHTASVRRNFMLLFQKDHSKNVERNHRTRMFRLNCSINNTGTVVPSYLDIIFETDRYKNSSKVFKKRPKNSSNTWLPMSIVRQFSVAEASMRRISQRSFSVINGTMAGDVGFDPLGVCINYERLDRMREIELKHARIAMIAALGWPLSELLQPDSISMHITRLVSFFFFGESYPGHFEHSSNSGLPHPSVLSGELFLMKDTGVFFVVFSAFEYFAFLNRGSLSRRKREPGDFGMDPFNLYESRGSSPQAKKSMRRGEIWNGRLAMVAIVAYYLQEKLTHQSLVDVSSVFFQPIWLYFPPSV